MSLAFAPRYAAAQVAALVPAPEAAVEGPGVAIGDSLVLHPAVESEAGYISNVFYQDAGAIGTGIFRLSGKLDLASKKIDPETSFDFAEPDKDAAPRDLEMRVGARLSYEEMLSSRTTVRDQRNLNFDVDGHFVFRPGRPLSFQLDDHLIRDIRPRNFESTSSTGRISNGITVGATWAPGGGAIWAQLRYENYLDIFEADVNRFASRSNHTLGLQGNWQWLPFTRLFVDFTYGFFGPLGSSQLNGSPYKASSQPLRGVAGIATKISEAMTVKLRAGWQYASYSAGLGYNAPVAGIEWGYRYSPRGGLVLGYELERVDSVNSNFYRDHRLEAHVDHLLGRIQLTGGAALRFRRYVGIPVQVGAPQRDDVIFSLLARAAYTFSERYALTLQYVGTVVETDYRSMYSNVSDDPSFGRDELLLGFRAGF